MVWPEEREHTDFMDAVVRGRSQIFGKDTGSGFTRRDFIASGMGSAGKIVVVCGQAKSAVTDDDLHVLSLTIIDDGQYR